MARLTMTYELARACGQDAADRRMRKAGRKHWDADDYNEAVRVFEELWPLEAQFVSQGMSHDEAARAAQEIRTK